MTIRKLLRTGLAAAVLGATAPQSVAALKVHWPLDETSGVTAADASGNGYDGSWMGTVGAPGWVSGGMDGGAMQFTGANRDSVIVEGFAPLAGPPFTTSVWIKSSSANNSGLAYVGNGSGSSYYVLRMQGGLARANARNTTEVQGAGTTPVNNGEWHHLVAVYASDDERLLWVDGVLEHTNNTVVNPLVPSRFGIGGLTRNTPYNPADLYTGLLDDAAVWDRSFTARDVAALHGLGTLRAGNAGDLEALVEAFDSQDSVTIRGRLWEYATALGLPMGQTGGSVAELDAFIVLDEAGNGMRMAAAPGKPLVVSFTATPETVFLGNSATLSWVVADAVSVTISPEPGPVATTSGTATVSPLVTTTYTLTATNPSGSTQATVVATVSPDPVITRFTAAPATIFPGEEAVLSWEADNFTSLSIDGGVGTVSGQAGTIAVSPTGTTTYTLSATNANSTLTATTTVIVVARAQPLVHWALNETEGFTAPDSVGHLDGSILGDAAWFPGGGTLGGCLTCDGADDAVRLESPPVSGYPFVLSGWVNTSAAGRQITAYLGDGTSGDRYYAIGVNSNGTAYITAREANNFHEATGPAVSDGVWHQLVGVFESDTLKTLYVDGVQAATLTQNRPFIDTVNRFSAGRLDRVNPADHTNGSIDDIGLWGGLMTASDVAALNGMGRLGGDVSDFGRLLPAYVAGGSAVAAGATWSFSTGLGTFAGETGGSVSGGDAYLVFDASGNGMRVTASTRPVFTNVRKNADGSVALTWTSVPGASYRVEYTTNLQAWQLATATHPSGGSSTDFLYTAGPGPDPDTTPVLFFRATQLP